jgi:hypothetical protein
VQTEVEVYREVGEAVDISNNGHRPLSRKLSGEGWQATVTFMQTDTGRYSNLGKVR